LSNQLHILFLASWYPNRNQPVLGNFIAQHAKAAGIQHKVSVVAAFGVDSYPEVTVAEDGNVSEFVSHYNKVKNSVPIINSIRKAKAYKMALRLSIAEAIHKNGKPDILHVHVAWPAAIAALSIAEELQVPIVLTEHWSGYLQEDGNYRGRVLKHYTQKLFAAAKVVTVVSDHMKMAMKNHGLNANFRRLINAVNTDIFHSTVTQIEREKIPQFLHVSMLVDREKNISGLLTGFSEALRHHPMHLTIAGDGPERKKHEETADFLAIANHVSFVGLKNPNEVAALMNNSDALVMFSNFEGMPVTIIEAKCCGLPVIATHTGAIPEMLNGNTDILLAPRDTTALTAALIKLAESNRVIRAQKNRVAISIQAIQQYSMSAVAEQLNSIYKEVLSA